MENHLWRIRLQDSFKSRRRQQSLLQNHYGVLTYGYNMTVKFRTTGHEAIDRVLRGLPLQLHDRVLQQAHTAAAKPLVDKEKLTAPEGPTGNLVDSIGIVKASSRSIGRREL